jgi:hypothetical protein
MCCDQCCRNLLEIEDLEVELEALKRDLEFTPVLGLNGIWLENVRRSGIDILEDFIVRYDAAEKALLVTQEGRFVSLRKYFLEIP